MVEEGYLSGRLPFRPENKVNIVVTHLLSLEDFDKAELQGFLSRASALKQEAKSGLRHSQLEGKTIGLISEKPSTRTRVSFEVAMYGLGGQVIYLSGGDTQLARSEPLKDMARVMARYVDGMVIRTFGQEMIDEFAKYSSVPVINALTNLLHPCQILSDILTVIEKKGSLEDTKVAWLGDGFNMANSWIQAASILDFELVLACPKGYEPDSGILERGIARAKKPLRLIEDPAEAVKGADVINVDVWASMGHDQEIDERLQIFSPYQLNRELLNKAPSDAIVLHCLPAHRGEEITDEILESEQSVVFDQAENKMHMHKAILEKLIMANR